MRQALIGDFCNHLGAMNPSSEESEGNWTDFQNVVDSSAATTLGYPPSKHQDWFDENDKEIESLLEENTACKMHIKMIQTLNSIRLHTAIFEIQSRTDSGTCKTPGLARKQKKSSLLQTERT